MRNLLLTLTCIVLSVFTVHAQELNASVAIDAQQTGQPNQQVFRTLQQQITEFLNNTKWTNANFKNQERIDCNFSIIVSEYSNDLFTATLQVQASRPIFNSTYDSPIYNYNDRNFSFDYIEFQNLNFNINNFDSNLISVLAYHVYTIIGLDAATYEEGGGDTYFEIAKQIINTAASSNFLGWKASDGQQSRFRYNDMLLSNVYREFHQAMYQYHRIGLDTMEKNPKNAKMAVISSIATLKRINDRRPNSFLLRTFFDTKADEIQSIFSGGPQVNITALVNNLNRMSPTKRSNWQEIKF